MKPADVVTACAAAGVELALPAAERLVHYVQVLLEANERTNLTRIVKPQEVLDKHLIDALLGLEQLTPPVVDVGTGGGIPGLIFACVHPEWTITLVESLSRKTAFLEHACVELGLDNVRVHCARAEAVGQGALREQARTVTLRAVSSLSTCLELGLPLAQVGGSLLLYRGPEVEDLPAVNAVAAKLGGGEATLRSYALPDGARRNLVQVPKVAPSPETYPRRDGVPAKRPLKA